MSDEAVDLEPRTVFLLAFFFELALVFIAALIGLMFGGSAFPFRLGFDIPSLGAGLTAAVPMVVLAVFLSSPLAWRIGPLRRMHERITAILGGAIRAMSGPEIVLFACAAGVGEEVLFRGVVQTVTGAYGLWISSVIFGVLHALTFTYCLFALACGLYLGWLFQTTGNLLAPILVHSILDGVGLWLIQRRLLADQAREAQPTSSSEE